MFRKPPRGSPWMAVEEWLPVWSRLHESVSFVCRAARLTFSLKCAWQRRQHLPAASLIKNLTGRERLLHLQKWENCLLLILCCWCRTDCSLQGAPTCCKNTLFLLPWRKETRQPTLTWWAACSFMRTLLSESQKRIEPSLEELTQTWLCPACWQKEKPDTRSRWPASSPETHAESWISS